MKSSSVLKIGAVVFIFIIITRILGYLFRIIIARHDFNLYGQYNLALIIINIIIPIILLGFTFGIIRYVSFYNARGEKEKSNEIISTALKITAPLSIVVFLLIFFFSNQITQFFGLEEISKMLKYLSILIPLITISNILMSVLEANKKPGTSIFMGQLVPNFSRILLIIPLILLGLTENAIIISFIISYSISLTVLYIVTKPKFKFKGTNYKLLQFSWPLIFISLGITVMVQIDTLFLGILTNISEVSLYSAAYPTAQLLTIFSISILSLFLPTITEKHAKKESIKKEYKFAMVALTSISLLATFLIILLSKPIISALFGENYVGASIPLSILAVAYFFFNISQPSHRVLLMKKKTKLLLGIFMIALITNIILNIFLIPYTHSTFGHGMYGAALATLVSFAILSLLTIFLSRKSIR